MAMVASYDWESDTFTTNGHTNGTTPAQPGPTGHATDEAIDSLYSWFPGLQAPAPQPLPEAAFSLTLKGTLDGVETLLTVRGMTAAEFKANLAAVRGLLDAPKAPAPPSSQGAASPQQPGWCPIHHMQMKENVKEGRRWFSHRVDGQWCRGK